MTGTQRTVTMREISAAHRHPTGMTITLNCGHERWLGGEKRNPSEMLGQVRECLDSPCYRPFRELAAW